MHLLKQIDTHRLLIFFSLILGCFAFPAAGEEAEEIDSDSCSDCHETGIHGTVIQDDLSHSIHEDLECQDCHQDKEYYPHEEAYLDVGCEGCRTCHDDQSEEYQAHGREIVGECGDIPSCADCHGTHEVLPPDIKHSLVHPTNLPATCGRCHENLDLINQYDLLLSHPVEMYSNSVHGKATTGGIYVAATCDDCHSSGGSSHHIYSPGHPESAINHFNIPQTCGKCHRGIENDFMDGIHGKLVDRGETDAPVCTDCHGEHGIISPSDPRSPVSAARLAEATCSPCHESTRLNEKYGLPTGRLNTFVDSYHGLKSKAGDTHVANCASCHGVHRILPSTDPSSTVHPNNLRATCGECHPGISAKLASTAIHSVSGTGLQTTVADIVEKIYIVAIVIIIGFMVIHWILDLYRQLRLVIKKPQIRRMKLHEVWQHTFLMVSFIALVITGFSLRFSESWMAKTFFGWEGGFEMRGLAHRYAAVLFIITVLWHTIFLFTRRGRQFLVDMWPRLLDFTQFGHRIAFYLGLSKTSPRFKRFGYVEKAEYWALVWGTVVMIVSGLLLWFDNYFIQFFPKGVLDVALVVHYWEAWLATLAIAIWHFYSTVFNPEVYPMNPSWLTGKMPEDMYAHEHPDYVEEAKAEMERDLKNELKKMKELSHISENNRK